MAEPSNPAAWFRTFGRSKSSLQQPTTTSTTSPNRPDTPSITSTTITTTTSYHGTEPPATPTPDTSPSRLRTRPAAAVRRVSSLFSLVGGGGGPKEGSFPVNNLPGRAPPMGALPLSGFHDEGAGGYGGAGLQGLMGGLGVGGRRGEEESIVWSRPNMMQMVETLRGVMMGVMRMPDRGRGEWERDREVREKERRWGERGERGGLPVEYNSHVLVLLEGFGHLVEQLNKTQEELAELKNLREKEVEQFRGISEEWIQRENGYKAEIKRLELVLAKESKDGVASVALARHGSLINRSGTKKFQARLKRLSSSQDVDNTREPYADPEPSLVEIKEARLRYETIGDIPRDVNLQRDVLLSRLVEKQAKVSSRRHHQEGGPALNQILPDTGSTNQQASPSTHGNQRNEDIEYPASGEATLKVRSTRERAPWYEKGKGEANAGPNSQAYAGVADPTAADPSADESSASSRWDAESSTSDDSLPGNGLLLVGSQPRRSHDSGRGLFDGTNSRLADNGLGAIHEGTGHMLDLVSLNHHGDRPTGSNPVSTSSYINGDEGSDGQEAWARRGHTSLGTVGSQSVVERRRRPSPHLNRGYSFKRGDDEHLPVTSPSHRKAKGPDSDSMYLYTHTPFDYVSSVRSDCMGSPSEKRPARPASLAPSTSTGSVIWRGNDDKKATISRKDDDRTPRASACENHGEDSDGGSQQ
ncbi:hypothetical protein QBC41DRAFT_387714 [Cercophora samala]|uniref:Uncharacterized protein n=1 Tax=Cercophora samala TaxID=330535 RepID=A0AA39ZHV4_9PEZI|nr:hypothetical protein QBC41DRAFT_387714 [Cercophora samala]